jgi:hypothetical protein
MIFKEGDILEFHYSREHPDCKVISESTQDDGIRLVNLISSEGLFITYRRGYLLSQITGGWISFRHYGKELEPKYLVKELEWV